MADKKDLSSMPLIETTFHAPGCGCDARRQFEAEYTEGGPSKVNSAAYKTGWDRIFGTKPALGEA